MRNMTSRPFSTPKRNISGRVRASTPTPIHMARRMLDKGERFSAARSHTAVSTVWSTREIPAATAMAR